MNSLNNYTKWLQNKNLANSTIALYQQVIKNHPQPLNTVKIQQFIQAGLKKYQVSYLILQREILKSYAQYQKKKINWERINKLIPTIQRKFFSTINENELKQLKSVRFEKQSQVWERNNLILDFLFYTGIRVSELTNLKHSDWENNSLKILGKGNKLRYVFLPEFLIKHIDPYSTNYLFLNAKKQKLTCEYLVKLIKKRTLLALIKKRITPHTFRRSFATLLNNKGAKLTTIQKLLGHSHLQTTANYIHNSYEELYADYSKLWRSPPLNERSQYANYS